MSPTDYAQFVRARFKLMPTRLESLMHVSVGLAGEWLELLSARTLDHRIEECGDCEFYIQAGYNLVGEPLRREPPLVFNTDAWAEDAATPLDMVKKAWVYNKPFDEALFAAALLRVQLNLEYYYSRYVTVARDAVIDANVKKLSKRFPTGYSDDAAQARADKAINQGVTFPYRFIIVLEDYSLLGTNNEALAHQFSTESDDMVLDLETSKWLHDDQHLTITEADPTTFDEPESDE
jgi:hypothetical protein